MENLRELIVFVLFILGGSCSLAGTWWCKNKKKRNAGGESAGEETV